MEKRKLGFTDLEFTTIGLGTWAIGGDNWNMGWGEQDDKESINVIHKAIDLGVNWIDTAPIYGLGHAEKVVGKALKGKRDKVSIATKFSLVWDDSTKKVYNKLNPESIRKEIEDSLQRMSIDVIDLIQIHVPVPDEELEMAWDTVGELIQEGKIRYGGVSNFTLAQLKRLQVMHPIASLQPQYNMFVRDIEKDLIDYCGDNGIGLVVYSPIYAGLLSGKYDRERVNNLSEGDWRKKDANFSDPLIDINLDVIHKLSEIADAYGRPLSHLAIAWILRKDEITSAIVGSRKLSQIEENVNAAGWKLSDDTVKKIDTILSEREKKINQLK